MNFTLVPLDGEQPASQRPGYHLVSQSWFMFLAIHYLDAGQTEQQVADIMQAKFHERFKRYLRRNVTVDDIQTARLAFNEFFPDASLRACMARWTLTLSKYFYRTISTVVTEADAQTPESVQKVNELFKTYLTTRTFHQGHGVKSTIKGDEIATSFMLYGTNQKRQFLTPEGAVFHWCQTVPYQKYGSSLWKHADYHGQSSLVLSLLTRCLDGHSTLTSKVSDSQRHQEHANGNESFWLLVEYLNWLVHSNPLDEGKC